MKIKWTNRKLTLFIAMLIMCMLGGTIAIRYYFYRITLELEETRKDNKEYEWHVAFVAEDDTDPFTLAVMKSMAEEGEKAHVFVEFIGQELQKDYSKAELLSMAIAVKPDGIILEGDNSKETKQLVEQASKLNIPIVTVLSDCVGSKRKSYIGINSYTLGRDYGNQILNLTFDKKEAKLVIIMDEGKSDSEQSVVYSSICQTLANNSKTKYKLNTIQIKKGVDFEAEEKIRNLFVTEEQLPDIVICLNELYTTCAVHSIIDRNKVGQTQILGFYENDTILEAIRDKVVCSTITVDTEQIGQACIDAFVDYFETGYVNEYIAVDTSLMNQKNCE